MEPDLYEEMLAESRAQVRALFTEDPDLKAWAISYPGKGYSSRWAASSRHPPPSAKTYDVANVEKISAPAKSAFKQAVDDIWQGVDGLFTTPATLHNSHFWRTYLDALWFELGGLMMCRGGGRTESEVCHYLLTPLLKRVAHTSSMTLTPDGCTCGQCCSVLGMDTVLGMSDPDPDPLPTPRRASKRGGSRKLITPSVAVVKGKVENKKRTPSMSFLLRQRGNSN